MGKVRTEMVKRTARELLERDPDKFTADFEANKKVVSELFASDQKRLRNRVTGYVTRLKRVETARQALGATAEVIEEAASEQ